MARVLVLGRLAEIAGWRETAIAATDLAGLIAALPPDLRAAVSAPGIRIAVNQVVVTTGQGPLAPDDEVAFLPVYSGG